MIGVRMNPSHIQLIRKVCDARGEDLSDFVRRAIYKELAALSFLPKEQKKALGLIQVSQTTKKEAE